MSSRGFSNSAAIIPACSHHLGHGSLRCLSTLARQADAQDLPAAGQRQVPALLLLLPRENPRLCRGGCQSLTFPGGCSSPFGRASLASVQRHSLAPWPVARRPL